MSLVAWYPLNGDTLDYSGNNYNATNNGAAADSSGKIGGCYSFDGTTNDYLTTNISEPLESISIALWAKYTDFTYPKTFVAIKKSTGITYSAGVIGWDFGHSYTSLGVDVCLNDGTTSIRTTLVFDVGSRPSDLIGKWSHIIFVIDRQQSKVFAYVNGIKQSSSINIATITKSITNSGVLTFGQLYGWTTHGKMNDLRIYNHALSEKEIKEIAKAKILHYTFDDFQEPTENLIINPTFSTMSNWNLVKNGSGTFSVGSNFGKITIPDGETGKYYYLEQYYNKTTPANTSVTFSVEFRNNIVGTYGIRLVMWDAVTGSIPYQPTVTVNLDGKGGLKKRSVTVVHDTDSNKLRLDILAGSYYGGMSNLTVEFTNAQLERKDHATSFVDGSRIGKVKDLSGYGNDAVLGLSTSPQWVGDSKLGSGCYEFDGIDDYIEQTNLFGFENQGFTMSMFVRPNGFPLGYNPFLSRDGNLSNNLGVRVDASGYIEFRQYGGSEIRSAEPIPDGVFTHICVTCDELLNGKIYKNGILVGSGQFPTNFDINGVVRFGRYSYSTGYNYNGSIDDVRIYATALSDADIKELYQTRASLDDHGNLSVEGIKISNINSCPSFDNWEFTGGAYFDNGEAVLPVFGASVKSPFIRIRNDTMWTWSAAYYSNEESQNISFKPNAVLLQGSDYFDSNMNSTLNSAGYSGNGNAQQFPIGQWTRKKWDGSSGNSVEYLRINITNNVNYSSPSLRIKDPMVTKNRVWEVFYPYFNDVSITSIPKNADIDSNGVLYVPDISEVGITDGLVAYYPLDGNANDYSGNSNHGTVNGASISSGVKNQCYDFDGVDDYIITNNTLPYSNALTISSWFNKTGAGSNYECVLHHGIDSTIGSTDFWMGLSSTDYLTATIGGANLGWSAGQTTTLVELNKWYMLSATWDGSVVRVYIDGVYKKEYALTSIITRTVPIRIGSSTNGTVYLFNGKIDDVRIYNRALSPEEIAIQYDLTKENCAKMKITADTLYVSGQLKEV